MDQRLPDPAMAAPPDWRGLCEELFEALDGWHKAVFETGTGWVRPDETYLLDRARAGLAQPEPEGVGPTMQLPEQAPDEHPPSNLDRREIVAWYHGHGCGWQAARAVLARYGRPALAQPEPEVVGPGLTDQELLAVASGLPLNPDDDDILSLQRATIATALARWGRPTPAPAGEVAELVAEIRHFLNGYRQMRGLDPENIYSIHRGDVMEAHITVSGLTRAADLLEQHQAAPVPVAVSERLPQPEDCTSNPRNGQGEWCWGWRQDSSNSPFSGRWRMVPRAFMVEEATHWLPAHSLPLPSGKVEA